MNKIDTHLDLTADTPGFWDNFWTNNDGAGAGSKDPDSDSPKLQDYHRILWSRKLPNGDVMDLKKGYGSYYLTWSNFRFGSDSITASFRYKRYRWMLEKVAEELEDYKGFVENYLRKLYTIGGEIIFPKRMWGMNQSRGCNRYICDRRDLTLECIRRWYIGEQSPLYDVIEKDKDFFDLFVDFKGYIDYFLLQDCVSSDYSKVMIWGENTEFRKDPFPETVDDYLNWIQHELEFVELRNQRIERLVEQ